jgi:hypothetical protein
MNIDAFKETVDLEDAEEVEILIREDGKTLWINGSGRCLVRLCRIKGMVTVTDKRRQRQPRKRKPLNIE